MPTSREESFQPHIESVCDPEVARWVEKVAPSGADKSAPSRLQPAGR